MRGGAREGGRGWQGLELLHLSTIFRATCVGEGGGSEGVDVGGRGGGGGMLQFCT